MPKDYGTINFDKLFEKLERMAEKIENMSEEEREELKKSIFEAKESFQSTPKKDSNNLESKL